MEFVVTCNVRGFKKRSHVDFRLDDGGQIVPADDSEALRALVLKMAKKLGIDVATAEYRSSIGTRTPSKSVEELRKMVG